MTDISPMQRHAYERALDHLAQVLIDVLAAAPDLDTAAEDIAELVSDTLHESRADDHLASEFADQIEVCR